MPTKQERVDAVITANVGWTKAEEKFLLEMPDDKLSIIENSVKTPTPTPTPTPAPVPVPTPAPTPAPMTAEQYIASAPPAIREVLNHGLNAHAAEKNRLIGMITANANNRLSKEYLESRSIDELSGIAALAAPATPTGNSGHSIGILVPNYAGAAGAAPVTNQKEEEPLVLPVMNFSNK